MATITVNVLDTQIQFIVSISIGDVADWSVMICSNVDHGNGMGGACDVDIPYYVESIYGTNNTTFYKNKCSGAYSAAKYQAVLALKGMGAIDYDTFDISCGSGNNTINYSTFGKAKVEGGCIEFDNCNVGTSTATGNVKILNKVTINYPGTSIIRNTYSINGVAHDLDVSYNFTAGTHWLCFNDPNYNYKAGTYVHIGAWFL